MNQNKFLIDPPMLLDEYFNLFRAAFDELLLGICKQKTCTSFAWTDENYKKEQPRCQCTNENPMIYHSPRGFGVQADYFKNHSTLSKIYNLVELFPLDGNRIFRFVINTGGEWPVHRDKHNGTRMCKQLMFPLLNCNSNTKTRWYDLKKGDYTESSKVIILNRSNDTDLELIYEDSLLDNVPKIMDVGSWHNVVNFDNQMRVVVGFYIG
jgi:hypothetical protein